MASAASVQHADEGRAFQPAPKSSSNYYQEAVKIALQNLEEAALEARQEAEKWMQEAQLLEDRAHLLRSNTGSKPTLDGKFTPVINNWRNVKPAVALKEYMRQFPVGHKILVTEIVKDLERGGCVIYNKVRPGKVTPQIEKERNLFIAVTRNKEVIMGSPKTTREIWRIS